MTLIDIKPSRTVQLLEEVHRQTEMFTIPIPSSKTMQDYFEMFYIAGKLIINVDAALQLRDHVDIDRVETFFRIMEGHIQV